MLIRRKLHEQAMAAVDIRWQKFTHTFKLEWKNHHNRANQSALSLAYANWRNRFAQILTDAYYLLISSLVRSSQTKRCKTYLYCVTSISILLISIRVNQAFIPKTRKQPWDSKMVCRTNCPLSHMQVSWMYDPFKNSGFATLLKAILPINMLLNSVTKNPLVVNRLTNTTPMCRKSKLA